MSWRAQYDEVLPSEEWYTAISYRYQYGFPMHQLYARSTLKPDLSLCIVRRGELYGAVRADGSPVIPVRWHGVHPLPGPQGLFLVREHRDIYDYAGLCAADGRVLVEPVYGYIMAIEEDRLFVVRPQEMTGGGPDFAWVGWDGSLLEVMPYKPEGWRVTFCSGIVRVVKDGQYNFLDITGRLLSSQWWDETGKYGGISYFDHQEHPAVMTWVRSGSRYGFIDLESRLIVPLILDEVRDYGRGSDGLYGYDDPDRAAVRRGGKWGFIDDTGAIAVDFIFDEVDDFESGYAYGVIDGKQWRADLQGFVSPHIRSRETPSPTFFFSGNTIHGAQLADLYFKRGGHDHFYKEYFGEWRPRMLFIYIAGRCTLMELFEHLDEGGTLTDGTPDRRLFDRTIPMLRDTFANNPGCTAQQKAELDAQIYAACEAYIYTYLENGWLR